MRTIRILLLLLGASLLLTLLLSIGPDVVASSLYNLSWRLPLLCIFPFTIMTIFDTLGWRFAFRRDHVPFQRLLSTRLAGEAFNLTTPTASVGGEAVKAWLLRHHAPPGETLPSVIIAKTTITIAQGLFLLLGIGLGWSILPSGSGLLYAMAGLLVIEVLAVGGFVTVQMIGVLGRGKWLAGRLGLSWVGRQIDALLHLDHALADFYRNEPRRLSLSIGSHFVGWALGVVESYLILYFLGVPVSIATAAVIEACGTGIRFATFFIPASLGAFEGGQVAVFGALGLGASSGISFSLVRRIREATWVGIGLVSLSMMRPELKAMSPSGLNGEEACAG